MTSHVLRFIDRSRRSRDLLANSPCWSGLWNASVSPPNSFWEYSSNHQPDTQRDASTETPKDFTSHEAFISFELSPHCKRFPDRTTQKEAWGWQPLVYSDSWEGDIRNDYSPMSAARSSHFNNSGEVPSFQTSGLSDTSNGSHSFHNPYIATNILHMDHQRALHSPVQSRKSSSDAKASRVQLDVRTTGVRTPPSQQQQAAPIGPQTSPQRDSARADKEPASWIEALLPTSFRPFAHLARLDKPIGTWLLAWPCFWLVADMQRLGGLRSNR